MQRPSGSMAREVGWVLPAPFEAHGFMTTHRGGALLRRFQLGQSPTARRRVGGDVCPGLSSEAYIIVGLPRFAVGALFGQAFDYERAECRVFVAYFSRLQIGRRSECGLRLFQAVEGGHNYALG